MNLCPTAGTALCAALALVACSGMAPADPKYRGSELVVPLSQQLTVATQDRHVVEFVARSWCQAPGEATHPPARLESIVGDAIRSAAGAAPIGLLIEDRLRYQELLARAVRTRLEDIDYRLSRFELREVVLPPAIAESIRSQQEAEQEEMRRRNQAEAERRNRERNATP